MNLPKITSAMLVVTHACPLACRYCFVQQEPSRMTLQTAMDAARFLIKNAEEENRTPEINFFGGEPMVMWDEIIVPLTNWIRQEYQKPFKLGMTTNGVLLHEERLDYLRDNNVGILLSIDGAKATQDYNRPYHNGKSSFDVIDPLIPKILEVSPFTTFRMTTIPPTCHHIFDNIMYAQEKGFNNFFVIPNHFEEWNLDARQVVKAEMRKYSDYYIDCMRKKIEPIYCNVYTHAFKNIKRINRAAAQKLFRAGCVACHKCGLGATAFAAIHPNGNVFSCQEMTSNEGAESIFYIGNIFTGIDDNRRKNLMDLFDNNKVYGDNCEQCLYNVICDGECVVNNYLITKDISHMPDSVCWWKRLILDEAIYIVNILGTEENEFFKQRWDKY